VHLYYSFIKLLYIITYFRVFVLASPGFIIYQCPERLRCHTLHCLGFRSCRWAWSSTTVTEYATMMTMMIWMMTSQVKSNCL